MRIYLINAAPKRLSDDNSKETLFEASAPPLGLMYLASSLKKAGHGVFIIDQPAFNLTNEEVIEFIKKREPDIVGFSTLCASFENTKLMSKELKNWNPNLTIMVGNYLATFYARNILTKYDWIDICVRGEGEITTAELLERLDSNRDLSEIRGISYRKNDKITENKERPLIKDLDSLSFPDRKLLPAFYKNRIGGVDVTKRKFTTMVSSRGCPYSCSFCSCTAFSRGMWRTRSVDNIIDEIRMLSGEGYREILFIDDNFTLNQKRIDEFSKKIRKENFDIVFIGDGRVNNGSIELFKKLKQANFEMLMFGIESSSQRILDSYNKKITPELSRIAVNNARKAGFKFLIGSFMVGAYDETYQEAIDTLKFISSLDIDFPHIIFPRALPGTQIFNNLVSKKIIDEEKFWETGVDLIDLPGSKMNREIIFNIVKDQFHLNFFRPKYIMKALMRTFTSKYRREIIFNHMNFRDINKFIKIINNPPDLF